MVHSHDSLEPDAGLRGWRSLNLATALILAVILAIVTFLLTSDQKPIVRADRGITATTQSPATIAAAATTYPETTIADDSEDAAIDTRSVVLSLTGDISNMGPTDVGLVSHFPLVDYAWQRVEIEGEGHTDLLWLGELDENLVAVGSSWDEGWENQTLVTYVSADGLEWEAAGRQQLPDNAYLSQVVSDGERIYGFAEYWDEESGVSGYRFYVSEDGAAWTPTSFDLGGDDYDYVYVENAAAGPAGLAVAASFETYPEQEPLLLEFGEVQVRLDYTNEVYQLIDSGSGEELLGGSLDEIFNSNGEEGQPVYDPTTGEVIVTIPYLVWDAAYNSYFEDGGGTLLPLPVYSDEPDLGPVTIEYGGYVLEVDEEGGSYRVLDAETEEEIANGTLDYLYQGPPPRFVDPTTGTVLLEVTWDEWYVEEESAWRYSDESRGDYTRRTELLVSDDGTTWTSTTIPSRNGSDVSALLATGDGFIALVDSYSDNGETNSVWKYADGEWSNEDRDYTELWLSRITTTADGFVAIGEGGGGPAVWTSPDATDWLSEFAIVTQSDGSYVYLSDLAGDGAGTVAVLAQREKWSDYEPLVIEKDGYTLTFDDGETALAVTDAAGNVVLWLGWEDFDGDNADIATWEDGVTYIDLGNGDVVAITDDEAIQAIDERWAHQGEHGVSVFVGVDGTWAEAIVEAEGGLGGASQVYLHDGKIIIAGSAYTDEFAEYQSDGSGGSPIVVIVGSPII